jgi:hypothetical protein
MHRNHLRTIVGWLMIVGHLGLIVLILLHLDKYLDAKQKMQVILTLSPVTAAYFVSVVKSFVVDQEIFEPGRPVNLNFVGVAIVLPGCLIGFLYYLVLRYPDTIASDVNSLQTWTAAAEVALGGTVGFVVDDLFPKSKSQ